MGGTHAVLSLISFFASQGPAPEMMQRTSSCTLIKKSPHQHQPTVPCSPIQTTPHWAPWECTLSVSLWVYLISVHNSLFDPSPPRTSHKDHLYHEEPRTSHNLTVCLTHTHTTTHLGTLMTVVPLTVFPPLLPLWDEPSVAYFRLMMLDPEFPSRAAHLS